MKLCFISTMYGSPWGGSEELWFRTAMIALSKKDNVMVCVANWSPEPSRIRELRDAGATIVKRQLHVTSIASRIGKRIGVINTKKYLTNVRQFKPEVIVVCHGGTFESEFDRDADALRDELKCKLYLISQCNLESGGVLDKVTRSFYVNYLKRVSKFFFVSNRNRLTAERQLAHAITNAQLISNPASIKQASVKRWPESDILLMASVARLECSFKGQDILLQVLADSKWRSRSFHLSFFGSGPDESYLRDAIGYYQLADKVELKGHVNSIDEVWDKNQILVLTSLIEGTPLSMIEAMLSGRPVMGTNVGDISSYVISGKTGFLAPAATPESISASLEDVWNNRNQLREIGETAFVHAKSITDMEPHITLYNSITA